MTKVLDTLLLSLFSLKHTHLYIHDNTHHHLSHFNIQSNYPEVTEIIASDRGSEGRRRSDGRRSVGGRWGGGGGVCVCVCEGYRAALCRAGVKGGGVSGKVRQNEG
jgi:hypothetical protein